MRAIFFLYFFIFLLLCFFFFVYPSLSPPRDLFSTKSWLIPPPRAHTVLFFASPLFTSLPAATRITNFVHGILQGLKNESLFAVYSPGAYFPPRDWRPFPRRNSSKKETRDSSSINRSIYRFAQTPADLFPSRISTFASRKFAWGIEWRAPTIQTRECAAPHQKVTLPSFFTRSNLPTFPIQIPGDTERFVIIIRMSLRLNFNRLGRTWSGYLSKSRFLFPQSRDFSRKFILINKIE